MSVTVDINIPQDVVSLLLESGQSVAFAVQSGTPQILSTIWGVIRPSPMSTVQWSEQYGIYVANGPAIDGLQVKIITQLSNVLPGTVYPYLSTGQFGPPSGPGPNDGVTILNQNQLPNLAFGTLQPVFINNQAQGPAPILAATIPLQQRVTFPVITNVAFFITPQARAGQIISHIPFPNIIVNTQQNPVVHLSFNGQQWSQN